MRGKCKQRLSERRSDGRRKNKKGGYERSDAK